MSQSIEVSNCDNSFSDVTWNVIQKYFEDNPQALVQHHIDSYNYFVSHGINHIIKNSQYNRIEKIIKVTKEKSIKMVLVLGAVKDEKAPQDDDRVIIHYPPEVQSSEAVNDAKIKIKKESV